MATYTRILSQDQLSSACGACESHELDYKMGVDADAWWELAKDIAAFANYLGGTILVGVQEEPTGTGRVVGMKEPELERLAHAYEMAARDKCSPAAMVTLDRIPTDGGRSFVLAVNVEPYPDQLLGAMFVARNNSGSATTSNAWRFPVRIGRHTKFLKPEQLSMFMNSDIRRTIIRLESIPEKATKVLVWRRPTNPDNGTTDGQRDRHDEGRRAGELP